MFDPSSLFIKNCAEVTRGANLFCWVYHTAVIHSISLFLINLLDGNAALEGEEQSRLWQSDESCRSAVFSTCRRRVMDVIWTRARPFRLRNVLRRDLTEVCEGSVKAAHYNTASAWLGVTLILRS